MQPLILDQDGVIRFRANKIVRWLYDWAMPRGMGMNEIAMLAAGGMFDKADQEQFAQLIGYSVSGFGELSYVRDATYAEADKAAERLRAKLKKKRCRKSLSGGSR